MAPSQKRRSVGATIARAAACDEFALNLSEFKSLADFVAKKRRFSSEEEWRPSKPKMSRDMKSIYGANWPSKRRNGHPGGKQAKTNVSGLQLPENAHFMLEPCHKQRHLRIREQ